MLIDHHLDDRNLDQRVFDLRYSEIIEKYHQRNFMLRAVAFGSAIVAASYIAIPDAAKSELYSLIYNAYENAQHYLNYIL